MLIQQHNACPHYPVLSLQARFDGQEVAVLRPFHCSLFAAEENEAGSRVGGRTGETNCGVHGHVSIFPHTYIPSSTATRDKRLKRTRIKRVWVVGSFSIFSHPSTHVGNGAANESTLPICLFAGTNRKIN